MNSSEVRVLGPVQNMQVQRVERMSMLGIPQSGKTTLMNAMTGRFAIAGSPAKREPENESSWLVLNDSFVELVEQAAVSHGDVDSRLKMARIIGSDEYDLVLNVVDATNLYESLKLTMELLVFTNNVVVLLNKMDKAEEEGRIVDAYGLSLSLGVPVIPVVAVDSESVRRAAIDIEGIRDTLLSLCTHRQPWVEFEEDWQGASTRAICEKVVRLRE